MPQRVASNEDLHYLFIECRLLKLKNITQQPVKQKVTSSIDNSRKSIQLKWIRSQEAVIYNVSILLCFFFFVLQILKYAHSSFSSLMHFLLPKDILLRTYLKALVNASFFFLFALMLYIPVSNFSAMSELFLSS